MAHTIGVRARPIPAAIPRIVQPVRLPDEIHGHAGRDGHADRREQVHPECRLAERLEDDRREPAEQDVRREAGRVAGAHQRRDRLQLAGIPEGESGQQGDPGGGERDQGDQQGREQPGPDRRVVVGDGVGHGGKDAASGRNVRAARIAVHEGAT